MAAVPRYRVRVLQLSGQLLGEAELPETASVADIQAAIQQERQLDPVLKRTLIFEGRPLEDNQLLKEVPLPSPPSAVEMQGILQAQRAVRLTTLPNPCRLVQFAVVGARGVGKTSLAYRYAGNESRRPPTMAELPFARVLADGTPMRVLLWDTSRPAQFPTSLSLCGKDALLVVIDLTDPQSLIWVPGWIDSDATQSMPAKLLIGNKADVIAKRKISRREAEQYASAHGLTYFETSAQDGTGVDAAMDYAIFHTLSKLKSLPSEQATEPVREFPGCGLQ